MSERSKKLGSDTIHTDSSVQDRDDKVTVKVRYDVSKVVQLDGVQQSDMPDSRKTLLDTPAVVVNSNEDDQDIEEMDPESVVPITEEFPDESTLRQPDLQRQLMEQIEVYHKEYISLPPDIMARAEWENIIKRLTDNNFEKLKLAHAMQGHGQFFGIDTNGRALIKDRGTHPVMYGFYKFDKEPRHIYDRDKHADQMKKVEKWATGEEVRRRIEKDGYELFRDSGERDGGGLLPGDEMKQAESHTKKPFIACKAHSLMTWVQSGIDTLVLNVAFNYKSGGVGIMQMNPSASGETIGVIRLLRI